MRNIEIEKLSNTYLVRRLSSNDVDAVFDLCSKNSFYYQYCPPFITRGEVVEDMEALPSGKSQNDKFFLGYYEKGSLVAIIDLIMEYPDTQTAYIGLFMTDINVQGKGVGSAIIDELCIWLDKMGFQRVELAWVKGNPQSEKFWIKNRFVPIGERSSNVAEHVIAAERQL